LWIAQLHGVDLGAGRIITIVYVPNFFSHLFVVRTKNRKGKV